MIKIICLLVAVAMILPTLSIRANAFSEELTGKTAMEISTMMGKGWNLGNTFDAEGGKRDDVLSQEQSWGNPIVTEELIKGVKAAGFNTIRIPVTWYNRITPSENYKIDEDFMARVNEVVDYALDNDLFVILNVHHEKWVNDSNIDKNYVEIGKELEAVWTQIADNFADYDQHLIFEGMNEPRAKGKDYEWVGTNDCYDAVNYLNQVFVSTVRNSGKGHNNERALMIPGYAASNNPSVLKAIQIPEINGAPAENVIVSVHCYSPYNFCLSDNQYVFNPKNTDDTADITTMMSNINQMFLMKDIPVIIGECGATNTNDNHDARKEWFIYFGEITAKYNVPAILWDNGAIGNSGGECHNYFYRKTGEMYYPELLEAFIYGNVEAKKPKDMLIDFEPYKDDGGNTVLATPEEYGFEPSNMTKKSKINHTEGAGIGFSAVVTVADEQSYATMDMSKFANIPVEVTMYLRSDAEDDVTLGVLDSDETEIVTAHTGDDWIKVSYCHKFSEGAGEKKLFFKGTGASDFYIDDLSITMIEESAMKEASVGEGENEASISEGESQSGSADAEVNSGDSEASNENAESSDAKKGKSSGIAILIALLGALVCFFAVRKKHKQ